jgi:hypothetical protein
MNWFLLYIDPGTGSMLFSILIGIAATLYFVVRAVIIRAKVLFSGGRAASEYGRQKYVIYAEDKRYWNLFRPVLDEFEKRSTPLLYLTSSADDPCFTASYRHITFENIGTGNKSFARLNFLSADFVLMTTPGLNVYQIKRSKMVRHYSHVLHGVTDVTTYRMFGLDYFDSVLLTGDYQGADIRLLEKIRGLNKKELFTAGCSYLDEYAERIQELPEEANHVFTVLVSPSWGPSALLTRYGEKLLDPLAKCGWRIIIRPHPQSTLVEGNVLKRLEERYKNFANIEWDHERDNIYSLKKADVMISDFSGIIFDYVFLRNCPVIYVNYQLDLRPFDADDIDHEPWQMQILGEIGIELKEDDFTSIRKIIESLPDSSKLAEARRRAGETAWQYRGEAGRRIAEFMINTVNNLDG